MPYIGELSALLTACLWSGSAMMFASATQKVGSFQVNITRLILAAFYLLVLILLLPISVDLSANQLLYLSISGFIGLTLGDTFLFKAFQESGARLSMLVMSIAPAIAAILAFVVLGEVLSPIGILGIIVTVAGIGIVVLERGLTNTPAMTLTPSGFLYALGGAAGQGGGLVFAKMAFVEADLNGFVAAEVRILSSLVFLLPIALMSKRFQNPLRFFQQSKSAFKLTAMGSVFGPFLGISFSLIAVEHTNVGIAATLMAIVPILMLPLVRIVYKERLSWRAIFGAFIAVGGVAILFWR